MYNDDEWKPKRVTENFSTCYRNEVSHFILDSISEVMGDKSSLEILNSLNEYEKIIYEFYRFDDCIYKIEFLDNFYGFNKEFYIPIDNIKKFFEKSDYEYKKDFIKILDDYTYVYENLEKGDFVNKLDVRSSFLHSYKQLHLSIVDYLEDYLIKNMSDDYKEKIEKFYQTNYKL